MSFAKYGESKTSCGELEKWLLVTTKVLLKNSIDQKVLNGDIIDKNISI